MSGHKQAMGVHMGGYRIVATDLKRDRDLPSHKAVKSRKNTELVMPVHRERTRNFSTVTASSKAGAGKVEVNEDDSLLQEILGDAGDEAPITRSWREEAVYRRKPGTPGEMESEKESSFIKKYVVIK
jgi:hypothetical protein